MVCWPVEVVTQLQKSMAAPHIQVLVLLLVLVLLQDIQVQMMVVVVAVEVVVVQLNHSKLILNPVQATLVYS